MSGEVSTVYRLYLLKFFLWGAGVKSNLVSSVLAGAIDTGVLGLLSPGGFGLR